MMGSPENEKDRGTDENQVPVKLSSFAIGETEVTQAQFQSVMGYNPSINEGDNLPVSGVSWYEAMEFCHILTAQEREKGRLPVGLKFMLPTEAQWEYSCRAGTTTRFSFGDSKRDLYLYANFWCYKAEYQDDGFEDLSPVGSLRPNAWGIYDMHGNVWEWTSTPFGSNRVSCGGSWINYADGCESSDWYSVSQEDRRDRIGFRVMLSEVEYIWDL